MKEETMDLTTTDSEIEVADPEEDGPESEDGGDRFMTGRPELVETLRKGTYSDRAEYWIGAEYALMAILRNRGTAARPSVESFYRNRSNVVNDTKRVLGDLEGKALVHIESMKRMGRSLIPARRFNAVREEVNRLPKIASHMDADGRFAFNAGLNSAHLFLENEARELSKWAKARKAKAGNRAA